MPGSDFSFERYLNTRKAFGPSFSPDGSRLTFLTDITGVAEVWSVPVEMGSARPAWPEQLSFRGERCDTARFSPTSNRLLVEGDVGGAERTQLFALSGDGASLLPLTHQPEVIHTFGSWAPDGPRISYATNARDARYFDVYELTLDGSVPRRVLEHDGTNYALRYAPDGKHLLVSRLESNTRNALLLLDLETGETRRLTPEVAEGSAEHTSPAWTPDGKGFYLLSNRGREFMSLAWMDVASGEMVYLREDKWDDEEVALAPDGSRLALITNVEGYSRLALWDVSNGWEARRELPTPTLPQGVIHDLAWSRDGRRLAFAHESADAVSDVRVWDVDERVLWQATRSTTAGIPTERFIAPKLVHYPTFDGREIPGFLFLPQDKPAQKLPVILYVHGGPESQLRPTFNPILQYLAGHGYAILAPNVRGSSGHGHTYQSLDDVRLRMDSVADLRAAALWLAESGVADPAKIAIMGRSYGGFMVLAAVTTYPELWAAGVDIVGIANWVSFMENTGPWRRKWRETEYGSLENDREFLEEISPIRKVDRITAPMFVLHGANDARVPVGEAEQIVAALRAREVPVEYLRFEDEGHIFGKRASNLAAYPAIARFLDKHLGVGEG